MEGGPGPVVLLAVVADLLAEDDVVVVEEDVAPLTLVAVEKGSRRHEGAFAAALRRNDLHALYNCTVWGFRLFQRFCKMFPES